MIRVCNFHFMSFLHGGALLDDDLQPYLPIPYMEFPHLAEVTKPPFLLFWL